MSKLIKAYSMGDMQAIYILNEENHNPELVLLPQGAEYVDQDEKKEKPYTDNLVQVKILGDTYMGGYAPGVTMRQSPTTLGFKYVGQEIVEDAGDNSGTYCTVTAPGAADRITIAPGAADRITIAPSGAAPGAADCIAAAPGATAPGAVRNIITTLADDRGYEIRHHLRYVEGEKAFRIYTEFENKTTEKVGIELLSSFSLGKISPLMEGDGYGTIKLHRVRSVWSMEGRVETISLEDLQLEPSWGGHAVRCERFGCVGSLPVNRYFPCAVVEDTRNQLFWGAQLAHNASWQMEVYRRGDYVQLSGGLADREFGHWLKYVEPGEIFVTPEAIVSVCQSSDPDVIYQRLTSELLATFKMGPASEQSLPMIFNEYCTTWGDPSHENLKGIVSAIKGKPFDYFIIDCGWYREKNVPWDISMGDYEPSEDLYPQGLAYTVNQIHDAGFKAGIWFEIDNVGSASKAYQREDMLLQRDGRPVTTTMRRFWDLRQEKVQEYLADKVIGTLKKYGLDYMKIDCNDTVGIGCDGAESLGEGLRQNQRASIDFLRRVKEECPGIILENCASGGHKLEPLMMSLCSMASFSDAHECEEIPIIAANVHRVILPAQSQIWAVIREDDSLKRIAYSVANTFLGRMCISGDVHKLSSEQWKVIDEGMAFYQKIAPVIKEGFTSFYGSTIVSYRHPEGWQGVLRQGTTEENGNQAFLLLHGFNNIKGSTVQVELPACYEVVEYYSYCQEEIKITGNILEYTFHDDMEAVAVILNQGDGVGGSFS